jgi:hypothetical protein
VATPQAKFSLQFFFARATIFLLKERENFAFGVLL